MCEELGLIEKDTITKCLTNESQLNMKQYPPHEIEEIKKCFALYIKFPKNRWHEIARAEKNDSEGNKIYQNLKEEYLEKYMPKPDADPHGTESFEDVENPYCIPTKQDNNINKKTHSVDFNNLNKNQYEDEMI